MERPVSARWGEAATAAALGAVGALFAWQASRLSFGSLAEPGPGFFPLVLGLALLVCAAALLWRLRATVDFGTTALGHRDVVIAYLALLAVPLGFERVGADATLAAFVVVLLVALDRMTWWRAALGAAAGIGALWYFFKHLLGVQLPGAIL